jgi:putative transposase
VVWALDFQYDATTDGRPITLLNTVDEHTREALAKLIEPNLTAEHLAAVLDALVAARGVAPLLLRLDNGPELIAATLSDWCTGRTGIMFIPPGKPWKNPYIESFNARLRDECLNLHEFWSLTHARVISDWLTEYNHDRPHSALGYLTPAAYAAGITTTR